MFTALLIQATASSLCGDDATNLAHLSLVSLIYSALQCLSSSFRLNGSIGTQPFPDLCRDVKPDPGLVSLLEGRCWPGGEHHLLSFKQDLAFTLKSSIFVSSDQRMWFLMSEFFRCFVVNSMLGFWNFCLFCFVVAFSSSRGRGGSNSLVADATERHSSAGLFNLTPVIQRLIVSPAKVVLVSWWVLAPWNSFSDGSFLSLLKDHHVSWPEDNCTCS